MQDIPLHLKEKFEQFLQDNARPTNMGNWVDKDCIMQSLFAAYQLANEEKEKIQAQLNNQAKHKESVKQYWLSCSESKKKWVGAIKEYFDSEHPEDIQTFDGFVEQFDLD